MKVMFRGDFQITQQVIKANGAEHALKVKEVAASPEVLSAIRSLDKEICLQYTKQTVDDFYACAPQYGQDQIDVRVSVPEGGYVKLQKAGSSEYGTEVSLVRKAAKEAQPEKTFRYGFLWLKKGIEPATPSEQEEPIDAFILRAVNTVREVTQHNKDAAHITDVIS